MAVAAARPRDPESRAGERRSRPRGTAPGPRRRPGGASPSSFHCVLATPTRRQEILYLRRPMRRVAYFCMEYGLDPAFPIYAGGLGILAGDHMKSAGDLRVPITGIGLFWD